MAGFKEFAHEIRKRASDYSNATVQHVAIYAKDNNRVYIIDADGNLVDFEVADISCYNIDVRDDAHIGNTLDVSGNTSLWDDTYVDKTLTTRGNGYFQSDISVNGNGYVDGNVDIGGNNYIRGIIEVSGNGYFQSDISVNGNGYVDGNVDIGGNNYIRGIIEVSGNGYFQNNVTVSKTLNVIDDCYFYSNVDITGNLTIDGGYISVPQGNSNSEAFGYNALINNNGDRNTAIGHESLSSNSIGINNTACGFQSLYNNISGDANTANGGNSLYNNKTGSRNTAIGMGTLYNNISGSNNVAIGYDAGYNETGSNRLYITNSAGTSADALIYGEFDTKLLQFNAKISEASIKSISFVSTGTTTGTTRHLINKNTSTIASYTINFPSSPVNGQLFTFSTRGAITSLTVSGGSANTTPGSVLSNASWTWVYNTDDSIWMATIKG